MTIASHLRPYRHVGDASEHPDNGVIETGAVAVGLELPTNVLLAYSGARLAGGGLTGC
jgi:hypothetical protein